MVKWTRRMCISMYRSAKLARNWSYMVVLQCPPFWKLTVEWFWWRHRFRIASFSPNTLEKSVFKKHRFQIAPLWRAFSNGSVFGDRFRRCSVDDSRIRSKTAPFSFENGLVWLCTEPKCGKTPEMLSIKRVRFVILAGKGISIKGRECWQKQTWYNGKTSEMLSMKRVRWTFLG